MGEASYSLRRLRRGACTGSGSSTGVMVMGRRANENITDTSANGTNPRRSPTRISHWPTASATKLTDMYTANSLPRCSLGASALSQLSTTMYKPTRHMPVTSRSTPQNQGSTQRA